MGNYSTLSEAINELAKRGYTSNFNLNNDGLECAEKINLLKPEEFEIDEVYRFQDMSDLDIESILYAISSPKHNLKGLLVNAYGIYSDTATTELIEKLEVPRVGGA